jgi:hypothetical protein
MHIGSSPNHAKREQSKSDDCYSRHLMCERFEKKRKERIIGA